MNKKIYKECELTILMPCLNEAETLGVCISKAQKFIQNYKIDAEIVVADNGSTDGSIEIAEQLGARVVHVKNKGYGSALSSGAKNAFGKYIIMGDSDDSYDFLHLAPFVEKLREGYDLVMGNRFAGGIEKGAMPWLHRYIGNPILSFIGRLFFNSKIKDFHCGLRGYNKHNFEKLDLQTTGMEYASEMVVKAELHHLKITQVPTTLKKDGRSCKPHLRSFRDGWRHLKFLYMYTPNWLYLYPGFLLTLLGLIGSCLLLFTPIKIGNIVFSINTFLYCIFSLIIGINILLLFLFSKIYAYNNKFIPITKSIKKVLDIKEDYFIFAGLFSTLLGLIINISALYIWAKTGYQQLIPEIILRITISGAVIMELGLQFIFSGFFVGILKINNRGDDIK